MKEITKKEIEENSLDILHFLDLGIKKYNTPLSKQLEMVLKMYKFVVQNIKPVNSFWQETQYTSQSSGESETAEEKRRFAFEKLRQALVSNPGDTASNVILFNYLLYLKGFKSCIVLSESNNHKGEVHLSNLVEVGKDNWYFFDPSLERINFVEDQYKNPEEFSYSWAALGNKSYSKFYRPVLTIKEVGEKEIPISSYNVSKDSMLRELVENVGKGISDLSYVKAKVPVTQTQNKTITNKERDDK